MTRFLRLLLVLISVATPRLGSASEMDRVVRAMETQLGVRHTHIPMLGFAMFVGKVATGFQMPGVKLAVFENDGVSQRTPHELERAFSSALGPEWTPFVKSTSNHGAEQNWIYLRQQGKSMRMFIAAAERNELSLIELKASERQMRRWINDTDEMARSRK